MSRTDPQVNFRMPAELKQRLEKAAAQNRRSITAELVARLEESFLREGDDDPYELTTEISREKILKSAEKIQQDLALKMVKQALEEYMAKFATEETKESVRRIKAARVKKPEPDS